MLDNVLTIITEYAAFYNAETEKFKNKQSEIHERYSEGVAIEEDKKATEEYNQLIGDKRTEVVTSLDKEFDGATTYIRKNITREGIPTELIAEYEILKEMQISETELKALAGKYQSNYKAVKLLKVLADKNNILFEITTSDEQLEEVGELRQDCKDFVNRYCGAGTYKHELLLHGDKINRIRNVISKYVLTPTL